jgi:hypothetical protein
VILFPIPKAICHTPQENKTVTQQDPSNDSSPSSSHRPHHTCKNHSKDKKQVMITTPTGIQPNQPEDRTISAHPTEK